MEDQNKEGRNHEIIKTDRKRDATREVYREAMAKDWKAKG